MTQDDRTKRRFITLMSRCTVKERCAIEGLLENGDAALVKELLALLTKKYGPLDEPDRSDKFTWEVGDITITPPAAPTFGPCGTCLACEDGRPEACTDTPYLGRQ